MTADSLQPSAAARALAWLKSQVPNRDDASFILHCAAILVLLTIVRPMFHAAVPPAAYEHKSVTWGLLSADVNTIISAAQGQRPAVPRLAFVLVPTLLLALSKRRPRWQDWECGHALRGMVMVIMAGLCWAGAAFDYNLFLDRGHGWDRLLLLALLALSWRTPVAVPPFGALVIVMIREAANPIGHDEFDWRPIAELLALFAAFVWLSFKRTFNSRHFVFLALALLASYYWAAGRAKVTNGPEWSWVLENSLANLSASGYVHGWLGFVPEGTASAFHKLLRHFNVPMAVFTLCIELGSLLVFCPVRKVARGWWLLAATLHTGIFLLSGIFFWKWIVADVAIWWFLRHGGAQVHARFAKRLVLFAFGVLLLVYSVHRIYFYPQTRVFWYDTRMNELYHVFAVGESGQRYLVDPQYFSPMDAQMAMDNHCFLSDERRLTAVYGTTGSFGTFKALEAMKSPDDLAKIRQSRGGNCKKPEQAKNFDAFVSRFFRNLNRKKKRPWRFLSLVGRPHHLWTQRQDGPFFDKNERVVRVEVERQYVVHLQDGFHRLPSELIHSVDVPAR
jgi:hypothetical protein